MEYNSTSGIFLIEMVRLKGFRQREKCSQGERRILVEMRNTLDDSHRNYPMKSP